MIRPTKTEFCSLVLQKKKKESRRKEKKSLLNEKRPIFSLERGGDMMKNDRQWSLS